MTSTMVSVGTWARRAMVPAGPRALVVVVATMASGAVQLRVEVPLKVAPLARAESQPGPVGLVMVMVVATAVASVGMPLVLAVQSMARSVPGLSLVLGPVAGR